MSNPASINNPNPYYEYKMPQMTPQPYMTGRVQENTMTREYEKQAVLDALKARREKAEQENKEHIAKAKDAIEEGKSSEAISHLYRCDEEAVSHYRDLSARYEALAGDVVALGDSEARDIFKG